VPCALSPGATVWVLTILLFGLVGPAGPRAGPLSTERAAGEQRQNPVKQIGPGVFEIGKVRLNKNDRTVTIPAVLNMREGTVEYFLVTTSGKTHESIFRTEAEPYHVQLAMLLLDARGKGTNDFPEDTTQPPPVDPVQIEVVWKAFEKSSRIRAEDFVLDRSTGKSMQRVEWIYNGSQINADGFAAQQTGSIVSLINDPEAIINNPLPGRHDDENWRVAGDVIGQIKAPADVVITLPVKNREKPR